MNCDLYAHLLDLLSGWAGNMAGLPIKGNHPSKAKSHGLPPAALIGLVTLASSQQSW